MRHPSLIAILSVILPFLTSNCISIPIAASIPRTTPKASQSIIHTTTTSNPAPNQKLCGLPLVWVYPCTWTSDSSVSTLEKLGPVIWMKYLITIPANLVNSIFAPFATLQGSKRDNHDKVTKSRRSETKSRDTHGLHSSASSSLRVPRIFIIPTLAFKALSALPKATAAALLTNRQDGALGPNSCYDPRNKPYGAGFEWCEKVWQYVKKGTCPKTAAEIIMDIGGCLFPWRACPDPHSKPTAHAAVDEKDVKSATFTRGEVAVLESRYDPKKRPPDNGWEWCEEICEFTQKGGCTGWKPEAILGCDEEHPCELKKTLTVRRRRPSVRSVEAELKTGDVTGDVGVEVVESGFQEKTAGLPIDVPSPKPGDVWCSQLRQWASYCGPIEGLPHGASSSLRAPQTFTFPALAIRALSPIPKTLAAVIPLRRSSSDELESSGVISNSFQEKTAGDVWCSNLRQWASYCGPITGLPHGASASLRTPRVFIVPALAIKMLSSMPKTLAAVIPLRRSSREWKLALQRRENPASGVQSGQQIWSWCGTTPFFIYPCRVDIPEQTSLCPSDLNRTQCVEESVTKLKASVPGISCVPSLLLKTVKQVPKVAALALPSSPSNHLTSISLTLQHKLGLRAIQKLDKLQIDSSSFEGATVNSTTGISKGWQWSYCMKGGYVYPCVYNIPDVYVWCSDGINRKKGTCPRDLSSVSIHLESPGISTLPAAVIRGLGWIKNAVGAALPNKEIKRDIGKINGKKRGLRCEEGGYTGYPSCHKSTASSLHVPRIFTFPTLILETISFLPKALAINSFKAIVDNSTQQTSFNSTRHDIYCKGGGSGDNDPLRECVCTADGCSKISDSAGVRSVTIPRLFTLPSLLLKIPGTLARSCHGTGALSVPRVLVLPTLLFTPTPAKAIAIPKPEPITNSIADPNFDILRKSVDEVLAGTKYWIRRSDGQKPDNFCTSDEWKHSAACTGVGVHFDVETRVKVATMGALGLALVFAGFL